MPTRTAVSRTTAGTSPAEIERIIAATFGCTSDLATTIAAKARPRHYPARATIIERGGAFDHVQLVVEGHARMLAFSIDGRVVVVENFQRGDLFGEGSLFGANSAADEIAAVDTVEAAVFETPEFLGLMTNYSSIALAISRLLVARLNTTTRRMVEGATLSANGRIHAELLRQARTSPDLTIRPAPVLSTFALTVQSTRESVSRAINALQKRGIIRRDGDGLTVVAPHRLEELIF